MSKFKVGDPVRVILAGSKHFDAVGVVVTVFLSDHDLPEAYRVRVAPARHRIYGPSDLTLADPDVHTVLDQMDAESTDPVSSPSHYRSHPSGIETIQITRHESFLRGNVLKYVLRAPYKGSEIEDLKKAAQYLRWEIDRAEAAQ